MGELMYEVLIVYFSIALLILLVGYTNVVSAYYAWFPPFDYVQDARVVVNAANAVVSYEHGRRIIYVKPDGDSYTIEYSVVVPADGFNVLFYSSIPPDVSIYTGNGTCATAVGSIIENGVLKIRVNRVDDCTSTIIVEINTKASLQKDGITIGIYSVYDKLAIVEVEQLDIAGSSVSITPVQLSYTAYPISVKFALPVYILLTAFLGVLAIVVRKL